MSRSDSVRLSGRRTLSSALSFCLRPAPGSWTTGSSLRASPCSLGTRWGLPRAGWLSAAGFSGLRPLSCRLFGASGRRLGLRAKRALRAGAGSPPLLLPSGLARRCRLSPLPRDAPAGSAVPFAGTLLVGHPNVPPQKSQSPRICCDSSPRCVVMRRVPRLLLGPVLFQVSGGPG